MTYYLCDGQDEKCKRTNCHKAGGECRHTTSINHAISFRENGNGDHFEKYESSCEKVTTGLTINDLP